VFGKVEKISRKIVDGMKNIFTFVRRNNSKLHESKDLKIRGWHIGESPNVFSSFALLLLRSDHPPFIYPNVKIMRNNHDGDFQITKAERDYWCNPEPIKKRFVFKPEKWHNANTYDTNYMSPPSAPGVYMLVSSKYSFVRKKHIRKILYVGSSKNLLKRYNNHEVFNKIKDKYYYIQFYFRIEDDPINIERALIKMIQPKYNKQWR
jgi:hypothetical protein